MTSWADILLAEAGAGNAEALDSLRRILPSRMPGRERQRLRDSRLQQLAGLLRMHFVGESRTTLAGLIALAGAAIEGGDPLPTAPFAELGHDLPRFVAAIAEMLPLLTADPRTGRRWPCERTVRGAIA